jgi:ech hydrogenase subunit A
MPATLILILMPLMIASALPFVGAKVRNFLVVTGVFLLAGIAGWIAWDQTTFIAELPAWSHTLFIFFDIAVLCYFGWVGLRDHVPLIWGLALLQLLLYAAVLSIDHGTHGGDLFVDSLSRLMYLVITLVGGPIVLYALWYIETEPFDRAKKNRFIALLLFFVGVMAFIVSTDNIEIFFLLFELTTLCSYLLIAYRGDAEAVSNARKALWMNQIGGVAILLGLLGAIHWYQTTSFTLLLERADSTLLLPIVLLVVAAFVKGAAFPFQGWLLGAMVAPTPVSAMLHSATMVKLAPYLILKLAPTFSGYLATTVAIFSTFVFAGASLLALGKDRFKEILGLSTIALLALMMGLAAIGTASAMHAAMLLLFFHAVAKALLFMMAGILEKRDHAKSISDFGEVICHSPLSAYLIVIGFASLTLPPFGAFVGKFVAIESFTIEIARNPWQIISLILLVLGSALLTLLYFKLLTRILPWEVDGKPQEGSHHVPRWVHGTTIFLAVLLVGGIGWGWGMGLLTLMEVMIPLGILLVTALLFYFVLIRDAVRVGEYSCAEKEAPRLAAYYFTLPKRVERSLYQIGSLLILSVLAGGLL